MSKRIQNILPELESHISQHEKLNTKVSQRSVGWQLDHIFRSITSICEMYTESDPQKFKKKFNFSRSIVMSTGYIPRGVGKAPKNVMAETTVSEQELRIAFENALEALKSIDQVDSNKFFRHFIFGDMKLMDTKKFIYIHSYHHLKIIRDILKG